MRVIVNGDPVEIHEGATLYDLILSLAQNPEKLVSSVNDVIVRRKVYAETPVRDGDVIVLLAFVGGG